MRAACYEKKGAPDVLIEGEMADPAPDADEVRIRLSGLGIGPGDIKKREDAFHNGRPYSRVVPHGDGAGTIGQLGDGVSADRIGQSVWCLGAQSYRPFDTAAQFVVVAVDPAKHLPDGIEVATDACLGIPALTASAQARPHGRLLLEV